VRYVYACEPHFRTMFGGFTVIAATTTTTTTPPPPPAPAVTRLAAAVDATGPVRLRPRMIPRGRVRITVRDRSAQRNFHLAGPGFNRRTGRAFTGTAVWTARLAPGTYRFGSDPGRLAQTLHVH
jgi:hypothetical protein